MELIFLVTSRCYAAATLELSQPENEERKARALAAATKELERLFRKEDFGKMKVGACISSIFCSAFGFLKLFGFIYCIYILNIFIIIVNLFIYLSSFTKDPKLYPSLTYCAYIDSVIMLGDWAIQSWLHHWKVRSRFIYCRSGTFEAMHFKLSLSSIG